MASTSRALRLRFITVASALTAAVALGACSTQSSTQSTSTDVAPTTSAEGTSTTRSETTLVRESGSEVELLVGSLSATIIDVHPHDPDAFTQGLEVIGDGLLVEGTGRLGESDRRLVDIETGQVLQIVEIDTTLFGEGVTVVGDDVLQLTWKAGVLLRSDSITLAETGRTTYEGEGWGLCFDGESVAMSNGTSTLTFRDPATFDVIRTVEVTLDGQRLERINELECVHGQIVANVWLTDLIVVIDPGDGEVVGTLDGSVLRPPDLPAEDSSFALNGIAHDPATGHFFLTGKRWPVLYEVELS